MDTGPQSSRANLCAAPRQRKWYLPDEERSSLFSCLIHGLGTGRDDFVADLTDYMATLEDLEGLVDATYLDNIRHGEADPGELELYASSKLHNWNIEVKTVNADCKVVSTFIYSVEEPDKVVQLAPAGHSLLSLLALVPIATEKERPITLHTRCELHVGGLELQPAPQEG
ncbi:hypothetical protein GQ600_5039 [Phytophthora cactorum]|nr:hypothetical protein GQ600_5039 [Phytophthora cactorum]